MSGMFKVANDFFSSGNFEKAIERYEEIIFKYPGLTEFASGNLALARRKLGERQENKSKSLVNASKISESVFVGIAAIPERAKALEKTIESLLPQVEKIGVYLNGWKEVPDYLKNEKILVEGFGKEDLGDVGKFFWVDQHDGIYFSCDDDLIYPKDYVDRTVEKLKEKNYKAAIGWHGSLLKDNFSTYYDKNSRRVFVFSAHRPWDTPVHILGTGCSAFHTKFLKIKKSDFLHPNMADIFFSIKGQEQKIPFIVLAHEKDEITEFVGAKESSIYSHSQANVESKKNTHDLQNGFVMKNMPWVMNDVESLSVLIVGRFENYSKGGIYKSCHLIKEHLSALGHDVDIHDTQNPFAKALEKKYDLCWIYPGDPERPDFSSVEDKIYELKSRGIPVIVNLSYLYSEDRTIWIRNKIRDLNAKGTTPVLGAVFTETAANDPLLKDVRDYICVVPKTILPTPCERYYEFGEREGICLGDATKLGNAKVIGGNVNKWIDVIHNRLPHVNLYAYKQYQGNNPHPKIKYAPHMKENFGDWLAQRRIFICLNVHLTFEMVACEAQSYGTPVIYRHMPHSLSEYISATGFATRSPDEMAEMVAWLYNNKNSWNKMSQASLNNGKANNVNLLDSSLEGYLRLAILRIKKMMMK